MHTFELTSVDLQAFNQEKNSSMGDCEKKLEESLNKLKMKQEKYFSGDAFVGNTCKKAYDSIRKNDDTLVECLEDEPETREIFNNFQDFN